MGHRHAIAATTVLMMRRCGCASWRPFAGSHRRLRIPVLICVQFLRNVEWRLRSDLADYRSRRGLQAITE
jgi:hypothetical protein